MFGQAFLPLPFLQSSTPLLALLFAENLPFPRQRDTLLLFPSSSKSTATTAPLGRPDLSSPSRGAKTSGETRGILLSSLSMKTLPLSPSPPLRLPSGESALIWLNVAQSWQFAPSESQTTSPPPSSRSLLFLHPNILPAAVFVSFVSPSHSFAVPTAEIPPAPGP